MVYGLICILIEISIFKNVSPPKKMKTKECPGCAMEVDKNADVCPICGYEFPRQPLSFKIGVWILIFLLLVWYFL